MEPLIKPESQTRKLQTRLVLSMSLLTGITLIVLGFVVFFVTQQQLLRNLDRSLTQLASTEVASATDLGYVHVHEEPQELADLVGAQGYEKFVWLFDVKGKLVAHTSNIKQDLPLRGATPSIQKAWQGQKKFADLNYQGTRLRTIVYPFAGQDQAHYVGVIGVPRSVIDDALVDLERILLIVGSIGWAATIFAILLIARSAANPLNRLAQEVEQLSPETVSISTSFDAPYQEVSALTAAITGLSQRVRESIAGRDATIEHQRRFLADASHELRSPISNIQGHLEVSLRRKRNEEEYQDLMQTLLSEAQRMGRLVEELLALARNEIGKLELSKERISVNELIHQTLDAVRPLARPETTILTNLPQMCYANVDCDRMKQVFTNLLRNALTYCRNKVDISAAQLGDKIEITIKNDGDAIPEDQQAQIFEPFFRLDSSRSRDSGGTGLGLAIARAIIEMHNGNIRVHSSPTETVFVLELPAN